MRNLGTIAVLLAPVALGCAVVRPTSNRELQGTDLRACLIAAKAGVPNLAAPKSPGTAQLFQLVDVDGAVPASWVATAEMLDSAQFRNCIASVGTNSKFDGEHIDYLRGWVITCEGADCQRGVVHDLTKPMDVKIAKDSLNFADWATSVDKGWGYTYTQQYAEAIKAFEAALVLKADDVRAMRGLATALAESGGDLKKAREVAEKALAAKKDAGTIEALVRVCLKQNDDECVVKHFSEVGKSEGVKSRSLELATLNEPAKAALARLDASEKAKEEAAKKAREEALAKADPAGCYKMDGDAKAACYVKRCFGEGAVAYAKALLAATRVNYTVGEIAVASGTGGATLVTIPLRGPAVAVKGAKGKKATPVADIKDATWAVTLGEMVDMKPYKENLSAYNIAKDFNACKAQ